MVKCSVCGAKNPDSVMACVKCGAPLYYGVQQQPTLPPTPTQPQGVAGQAGGNSPVATVLYRPGPALLGIASTLTFTVIVIATFLLSGGVSYPILAFLAVLVGATLLNAFGRTRLARLRYEFYQDRVSINYGRGSVDIPYSDFEDVRLGPNRLVIELKPGARFRRLVVPGNPPVEGKTLYEWLSARIAGAEGSPGEGSGWFEPAGGSGRGAPPAP